jgi:hypothetical protein
MYLGAFHIVCFLMFTFLFVSFKTNNWTNIIFKMICFCLSIWSLLIILVDNGIVIKM